MRAYRVMTTVSTKKLYGGHSYDTSITRQQYDVEMDRQRATEERAERLFSGL